MGISAAVATVAGAAARVRHGSAIHEVGTVYTGRLRSVGGGPGPFERAGEREVVVRLSRALGLPAPLPDVFGVGVRVATPRGDQDLLLDSCAPGPLGRHTIVPRADLAAGPLGSLVSLHDGVRPYQLAGFPHAARPLRDTGAAVGLIVVLRVARPFGPWTTVGAVRVDAVADDQSVRMSPANAGLDVRLSPWWEQFRVRSYVASREAAQ